jgi:spore cortex biosynthesis protein YabQ
VFTGIAVIFMYDVLRIFRRIISHGVFAIGIEDFIYWVGCSFFVFHIIYIRNDGIIRGFAIIAIVLGMAFYHLTISNFLVKYTSMILNKLIKLMNAVINIVFSPAKWIGKKVSKVLKKCCKDVKIMVLKLKQGSG